MAAIEFITGDATAPVGPGNRIIAHICNDIGGWGRGFVLALSRRWPSVEAAYREWARREPLTLGAVQLVGAEPGLWVANMIGQHDIHTRDGVPPIRYEAVRTCLGELADLATRHQATVHMPRIGCGLAGGKWDQIEPLIEQTLVAAGVDVTIYDLPPD